MKTIKIHFDGFWKEYIPESSLIVKILSDHYQVSIEENPEDADYIFCSIFGRLYQFCKCKGVRIFLSAENYTPDFNLVDYSICPYPIEFLDRCVYKPVCFDDEGHFLSLQDKDRNYPDSILKEKEYFGNFIASHESEHNIRGDFFKKLCEYKRVESPGTYLYNMPEPVSVSHWDDSKIRFQRKCKFTLCFESTKHEGFVTEKITDAFYADTIPVYYGSDTVKDIFNPKAFINCSDYPNFDAVIEHIKELDQDDEKYLEMLRQPIFNQPKTPEQFYRNLENYLLHIFEQPLEKAYRRSNVFWPKAHEDYLLETFPTVKYRVIQLTNEYAAIKDCKEKRAEIAAIRKKLRKILKGHPARYPMETDHYLYEIAYPKRMHIYWTFKGLLLKFKRKP